MQNKKWVVAHISKCNEIDEGISDVTYLKVSNTMYQVVRMHFVILGAVARLKDITLVELA